MRRDSQPQLVRSCQFKEGDDLHPAENVEKMHGGTPLTDGRFVQNITIGPVVVEAVRRSAQKPLNVHLMIVEPERYFAAFAKAGADHLLVQVAISDATILNPYPNRIDRTQYRGSKTRTVPRCQLSLPAWPFGACWSCGHSRIVGLPNFISPGRTTCVCEWRFQCRTLSSNL